MTTEERIQLTKESERVKAMSKEEYLAYAKEAMRFCKEKNLFMPSELKDIKKNPDKWKDRLMKDCILRMTMYKITHPQTNS